MSLCFFIPTTIHPNSLSHVSTHNNNGNVQQRLHIVQQISKTDDAAIKGDWSWHAGHNQQRRNVEASGSEADTPCCVGE